MTTTEQIEIRLKFASIWTVFLLATFLEAVGEFAADTFDDRGEEDERHFATYKWPIHSLTTNELQIRPMMLGDYLSRRFRQMPSDELDEPEIRQLAIDESPAIGVIR